MTQLLSSKLDPADWKLGAAIPGQGPEEIPLRLVSARHICNADTLIGSVYGVLKSMEVHSQHLRQI